MIDFQAHKQVLLEKVKLKVEPEEPSKCEHEFRDYKQTIRVDNSRFLKSAYFVYKACPKCKTKLLKDYRII